MTRLREINLLWLDTTEAWCLFLRISDTKSWHCGCFLIEAKNREAAIAVATLVRSASIGTVENPVDEKGRGPAQILFPRCLCLK
jgi:hypothetical protein